jgi:histidinol-phosphate aminotransferase
MTQNSVLDRPRPPVRATLDTIAAYQAGMSLEEAARRYGRDDFCKLASNENLFGPSPKTLAAIQGALGHLEIYPDPFSAKLRSAIGDRLGVSASRVIIGSGSESLIDFFMRSILEPQDKVMWSSPTFPFYGIYAKAIGCTIIDVPRKADFSLDVDATIEALKQKPKLLVICTPNNPTGNAIGRAELERILAATSPETSILYDEAYFEYDEPTGALDLLAAWGGTWLLTRTFSKAYAIAALRVGYGIASSPELISYLDRIRPHFNITGPAQAAALAAWDDVDYLDKTIGITLAERTRIEAALDGMGIRRTVSRTNFVFVEAQAPVAEVMERLLQAGIIVRPIPLGPNGWLRISVGRPEDNDRMLAALPGAIR